MLNIKQKTHMTIENLDIYIKFLPIGKVKPYLEATEMLTILPMARLLCISNYSYSFVECEGIPVSKRFNYCRYGRVSLNEAIRFIEITEIIKMF